jgi:hypothetical protein
VEPAGCIDACAGQAQAGILPVSLATIKTIDETEGWG